MAGSHRTKAKGQMGPEPVSKPRGAAHHHARSYALKTNTSQKAERSHNSTKLTPCSNRRDFQQFAMPLSGLLLLQTSIKVPCDHGKIYLKAKKIGFVVSSGRLEE